MEYKMAQQAYFSGMIISVYYNLGCSFSYDNSVLTKVIAETWEPAKIVAT